MAKTDSAESSSNGSSHRRPKFGALLQSDPNIVTSSDEAYSSYSNRTSYASTIFSPSNYYKRSPMMSGDASPSPYLLSPWGQSSPYAKSPWFQSLEDYRSTPSRTGLFGSLVREEGHVYSLAVSFNLLYTGSDSKNIRVWRNLKEFSGFKSSSGLVKAIVVSGDRIFTGHQDGKIRVWKCSPMDSRRPYKRVGSLPTTKDFVKSALNPSNYVRVRRHRNVPWIRHFDAVSCLSLDEEQGIIYSGSWDKTVKVWRISDLKCLESIDAHEDAVNSVVAGFDGLLFTGSADGTVKVWRRELLGRTTKHVLVQILLQQVNAVTSVAVSMATATVYCGSSDGLVNFWVREKYELLHGGVLRGHKLAVLCLATGGNLVMSGSADKSICVWRRDDGGDHRCVNVLSGHCGPVKCLAVEEDQELWGAPKGGDQRFFVYSGSLDKSVKVWTVSDIAI